MQETFQIKFQDMILSAWTTFMGQSHRFQPAKCNKDWGQSPSDTRTLSRPANAKKGEIGTCPMLHFPKRESNISISH